MTLNKKLASRSYDKNVAYLKEELAVDKSFDLILLELEFHGLRMAIFVVDAFAKDMSLTQIQRELSKLKAEDLTGDVVKTLVKSKIPYIELETETDLNEIVIQVLSGPAALVVDGSSEVILIDTREYPIRGPEEPDTEQVIRGARDGFVETVVFNTGLIRRRVRDKSLRNEYIRVGVRSHTDMCITYMEDLADAKLVKYIRTALEKIETDGLPMGDKTLEEFIFGQHMNPYPLVRYTERPDVAASHLFEGHVLIVVDGSPSVIISPTTFWHHLQHAEEYRQKPVIGSALRLVRFLAVWVSIFLLPLWYLLAKNPNLLPAQLDYIGIEDAGRLPLIIQFLIAESGIEMLRMAAIHTPSALATALGLVAAILIGEVAIEVGLFSYEVVLYLAVSVVGSFATPSYEMGLANRLVRVMLLIIVSVFNVPGFVFGIAMLLILLTSMRVFETPYFWPFIPFQWKGARDVILRAPMPLKNRRPRAIHPADPDR
ncbi:spore germination protein [Salipaludibacillus neizhouensis]|uniref:Spore germination protein n=1 Tax=Salipaludibacillus neizhouensis TaxID=885475 RepID=A0A3A9KDZ7_9BACI|nr:spore germination protein [Salipaludibacillus neizhouensis]RKL68731.1 spore germination protein [Salipaludibacillus neizhouensis]